MVGWTTSGEKFRGSNEFWKVVRIRTHIRKRENVGGGDGTVSPVCSLGRPMKLSKSVWGYQRRAAP